nr:reverse transcriptase [Tanacetum cinerariifolium]
MLQNVQDEWIDDPKALNQLILNHFKAVYSSSRARDLCDVLESVEAVISDCMNCSLETPVSDSEIYKAVKQLGALKAHGKDGFPILFFQRYWHIVSNLVIKAVRQFFENGVMHPTLNKTIIVLIPKVPFPKKVERFHPISLCRLIQDSMVIENEAFHYIRNKKKGINGVDGFSLAFHHTSSKSQLM